MGIMEAILTLGLLVNFSLDYYNDKDGEVSTEIIKNKEVIDSYKITIDGNSDSIATNTKYINKLRGDILKVAKNSDLVTKDRSVYEMYEAQKHLISKTRTCIYMRETRIYTNRYFEKFASSSPYKFIIESRDNIEISVFWNIPPDVDPDKLSPKMMTRALQVAPKYLRFCAAPNHKIFKEEI